MKQNKTKRNIVSWLKMKTYLFESVILHFFTETIQKLNDSQLADSSYKKILC